LPQGIQKKKSKCLTIVWWGFIWGKRPLPVLVTNQGETGILGGKVEGKREKKASVGDWTAAKGSGEKALGNGVLGLFYEKKRYSNKTCKFM